MTTSRIDETVLTSQVTGFVHLLETFSQTLDQEAEAIKKNDTEALLESNTNKQTLAEKLAQAGNEIEQTLSPVCNNLIDFSVHENFSSLSESIQNLVKSAINLTVECHDKNLANGMSIQILSNINQHALDLLSGKSEQDVKLYGASGEKTSSSDQKSLGKA